MMGGMCHRVPPAGEAAQFGAGWMVQCSSIGPRSWMGVVVMAHESVIPGYVASQERLTADDVAAMVRVSPWTVRRLAREGRMPRPARFGRRLLWTREQIEAYLAGEEGAAHG